jgi:hypothetical protein
MSEITYSWHKFQAQTIEVLNSTKISIYWTEYELYGALNNIKLIIIFTILIKDRYNSGSPIQFYFNLQ